MKFKITMNNSEAHVNILKDNSSAILLDDSKTNSFAVNTKTLPSKFGFHDNVDVERSHIVAHVDNFVQSQGFEINHKVEWSAGDRLIDGISNLFGASEQRARTISESFKTCKDEGLDFYSFMTSKETLLIFVITALLIFSMIPTITSRNILIVALGLMALFFSIHQAVAGLDMAQLFMLINEVRRMPIIGDKDEEIQMAEAQSFKLDTPLVSNFLMVSLSMLAGYQVKKSFVQGLVSATKVNENQTSNITNLILSVSSGIHDYLNSISQHGLAKYFEIDDISDDRVITFQSKVFSFVSSFNAGSPESMLYCADVYKELYEEGRSLSKVLDKKSFDFRIVSDCITKILSVNSKISDMNLSLSGERIEPVGIMLKGSPATLKGVLAKRLAKVVAIATIPNEWKPAYRKDSKDFFFSVPNDQFWDSYTNKAWVSFFDDIFQRRDAVADSDADALKVIGMVNSAPYCLKMAKVEQKNNVFFRSAFLFATSNLSSWNQIQSVADVQAVQRRFHIEVDVTINRKYLGKDSKVDFSKLPISSIEDTSEIPNDFWILNVVEKKGSNISEKKTYTLAELICLIVSRHSLHKKNYFVNRHSEDRLVESLADELGYNWAESLSAHSSFDYGVAQSFYAKNKITKYLSDLPYETLKIYDDQFYTMLDKLKRTDLYLGTFLASVESYLHCGPTNPELENRVMNPNDFIKELERQFKDFIAIGVDPYTRQHDWIQIDKNRMSPLENLKNGFSFVINYLKRNWMFTLLGGFLTVSSIAYLSGFFSSILGAECQSVDFKRMGKRQGGPKKVIKLSAKTDLTKVQAQVGLAPSFEFSGLPKFSSSDFGERNNKNDVVAKIFNKNFFIAYIVDNLPGEDGNHEVIRVGHCLNIVGQLFLMPFHFIFVMDEYRKKNDYKGSTVVLVTSSGNNRYSLSLEEFLLSFKTSDDGADKDLCIVKVSSSQRMSKGAISSIVKRSDVSSIMRTTSFPATVLGSYHPDVTKDAVSIRNHYVQASINRGVVHIGAEWTSEPNTGYALFDTYIYRLNCARGDCGSLLMVSDGNYENRIICGMHVAGYEQMGYATGFDRELIEDMIFHTFGKQEVFQDEEIPDFLKPVEFLESQSGLKPSYKLDSKFCSAEIYKSEIRKSRLFGKLPEPYNKVKTMPARLAPFYNNDGELVDPILKAFNKYDKIAPDIPKDLVDRAVNSYENLVLQHDNSEPSSRRIISLKEALHSFENVNSISSSTSSGFPMCLSNQEDLKKKYYTSLFENRISDAELAYQRIASVVESKLDLYKNGIRPLWLYKICGKDETREWFKVLEGKTRAFMASPFIMIVLFRMYFGSFVSMFIENNSSIGSAIGVNPYSHNWDEIARRLLKFSDSDNDLTIAAGDQGGFDTRQWPIVHNAILEMINRWYRGNQDENYIRSALYMELTNSRHVFRNHVYEWNSGLPSGNPLTAIVNTIYNNLIFRMSWELAGLKMNLFNDNVYLIVLGDDNAFSVKKEFRDVFNEMTLPKYMELIGNEYTTELKGEAATPFRRLSDIEFLKRSFIKDKKLNRWIAPLRESAIAEMLNWTKKGREGDQITLDNMVFAMREFSLHGKEKFEFWRNRLMDLKIKLFPNSKPHGEFPLNFDVCYVEVLGTDYLF